MPAAFAVIIAASAVATPAMADDLVGTATYKGLVRAVAAGFFSAVGVTLENGTTCNGHREVMLVPSNPRYEEIMALLISAQVSHSTVSLYSLPANQPSGSGYCTINEAALGDFSAW